MLSYNHYLEELGIKKLIFLLEMKMMTLDTKLMKKGLENVNFEVQIIVQLVIFILIYAILEIIVCADILCM